MDELTQRFLDVINRLKSDGIVKNDSAMAEKINISRSLMSKNMSYGKAERKGDSPPDGSQPVTMETINKVIAAFPTINANFLRHGEGSIYINEEPAPPSDLRERIVISVNYLANEQGISLKDFVSDYGYNRFLNYKQGIVKHPPDELLDLIFNREGLRASPIYLINGSGSPVVEDVSSKVLQERVASSIREIELLRDHIAQLKSDATSLREQNSMLLQQLSHLMSLLNPEGRGGNS